MPYHGLEFRSKIQFTAMARMPSLIYKAAVKTGAASNTHYIQTAICEALARDLDLDLDTLLAELPPRRGPSAALFGSDRRARRRRPVEKVR